jgi:hypothetical protein
MMTREYWSSSSKVGGERYKEAIPGKGSKDDEVDECEKA